MLRLILAAVVLAGIAAGTTLSALGHEAAEAWGIAVAALGVLTGQHLDKPGG